MHLSMEFCDNKMGITLDSCNITKKIFFKKFSKKSRQNLIQAFFNSSNENVNFSQPHIKINYQQFLP